MTVALRERSPVAQTLELAAGAQHAQVPAAMRRLISRGDAVVARGKGWPKRPAHAAGWAVRDCDHRNVCALITHRRDRDVAVAADLRAVSVHHTFAG